MKKALLLLFVLSGAFPAFSGTNQPMTENMDPFGARDLCGKETYEQDFGMDISSFSCIRQQVKLFYHFRAATTATGLPIATITTTAASDYRIFGPFTSVQQGAEMINQNIAPVVSASGSSSGSHTISVNSIANGIYILQIQVYKCQGGISFDLESRNISCSVAVSCESCLPSFNPREASYVLSAWVKEGHATPSKTTYDRPSIVISFPAASVSHTFHPSGRIIDGWQRIEAIFSSPGGDMQLTLQASMGDVFFDDIRIFPFEGSMISYVYDPLTLRLVAELDERNYAKIYEYDEEGKLTRVKKETEKGIMTIQENRENSVKKP